MVEYNKNMPDGSLGEVDLKNEDGEVIGKAQLEKVGDTVMVHMDASDMPEAVTKGFRLGSYSIYERESAEGLEPLIHPYNMRAEETMLKVRAAIDMEKRSGTFGA